MRVNVWGRGGRQEMGLGPWQGVGVEGDSLVPIFKKGKQGDWVLIGRLS